MIRSLVNSSQRTIQPEYLKVSFLLWHSDKGALNINFKIIFQSLFDKPSSEQVNKIANIYDNLKDAII